MSNQGSQNGIPKPARFFNRTVLLIGTSVLVALLTASIIGYDIYTFATGRVRIWHVFPLVIPSILDHPQVKEKLGGPVSTLAIHKGFTTANAFPIPEGISIHLAGTRCEGDLLIHAHQHDRKWTITSVQLVTQYGETTTLTKTPCAPPPA